MICTPGRSGFSTAQTWKTHCVSSNRALRGPSETGSGKTGCRSFAPAYPATRPCRHFPATALRSQLIEKVRRKRQVRPRLLAIRIARDDHRQTLLDDARRIGGQRLASRVLLAALRRRGRRRLRQRPARRLSGDFIQCRARFPFKQRQLRVAQTLPLGPNLVIGGNPRNPSPLMILNPAVATAVSGPSN